MSDETPKRKRGRPRKAPPKVRRLGHSIPEWCATTNKSRSTAERWISNGKLKCIQPGGPGSPRIIPTSEYVRHGFVETVDEV
jgi:hypothetical protein